VKPLTIALLLESLRADRTAEGSRFWIKGQPNLASPSSWAARGASPMP